MADLTISIPDQLKGWAEARVAEGLYSSTGDYVRDLMRRDQAAAEQEARNIERLRAAWDEGLASGEPVPMPDDWAEQVIARGRKRLAAIAAE